jgi:hypothetical protein
MQSSIPSGSRWVVLPHAEILDILRCIYERSNFIYKRPILIPGTRLGPPDLGSFDITFLGKFLLEETPELIDIH